MAGEADLRALENRADEVALLALDVRTHRARALVAAMVVALGGVDVLAFSGGVGEGEHQPRRRTAIVDGLGFLGLALDPSPTPKRR